MREDAAPSRRPDGDRSDAGAQVAIAVEAVTKRFGTFEAVRDATLRIEEGEFFSLLGPSGCGKTTTLRMIAGFLTPDEGSIRLRGEDVTARPANRRDINLAFQHYALFPHMSVFDNVAFGLKLKGVKRGERRERVREILRMVGLEGFDKRHPRQLSGGQQQRVALARALVNRPAALLLDEPLGALDVQLRRHMQGELKRIQHELGTTFVYVTHDQEEALSMSDRIALMHEGRVEQIGTPQEIYERPRTDFVAAFVGSLNDFAFEAPVVDGEVARTELAGDQRLVGPAAELNGAGGRLAVRPERVRVHDAGGAAVAALGADVARLDGVIRDVVYLGGLIQVRVETTAVGTVLCHRLNDPSTVALRPDQPVVVTWGAHDATFITGEEAEPAPAPER